MRLRLRAAGFVALAVVAITCTESTTGPRRDAAGAGIAGRVALAPQFTPAAARAYQALVALGTDITEVHVHLTAADGSTRDTVINFPLGQDSLRIEIPVDAAQNDQPFTALLELRAADHTVLFSGTQVVVARPANLPPINPPVVIITYSGPGKRTRTVALSPPDTTVKGSPTLAYTATGVDSSNAPVVGLLVSWLTSDPTVATLAATGNSTATVTATGKRGFTTLTATTPTGIVGTSKLTVVPPATKLVVISGGGQTGVAGSVLPQPLVVEVQAADNLPVPGTPITFSAVTAGGAVTTATVTSDAVGRASTTLTLGKTGGSYAYAAASTGLATVTVSETATPAPAAALALVSGDGQTDSTGRTLAQPLVVKVTDQFGGPAAGATVTWTRASGSGTLGAATTPSAADGTASTSYTLGQVVGTDVVTATLAGVSGAAGTVTFTLHTVNRGAGSIAIITGAGQIGAPNTALPTPFVARVTDASGNPTPNQLVTWTASANGASFSPAAATTGANGQVSTLVTLGGTVGSVTITAAAGSVTAGATVTIAAGPPASITKNAGDLQTAVAGTALPIAASVIVKDVGGNPVPNAAVLFAIASGGGVVNGANATTNAQGIATVGSWTLGGIAGPNTLTATVGTFTTTFSATGVAGTGSQLAFTTTPSATATNAVALAQQPVVQLKDAQGNNVATSGVVVTAVVASGSGTLTNATASTTAGGTATFSGLAITGLVGNVTLSFSAPGYPALVSGTIALNAGAAATLTIVAGNNQTATAGSAVAVAPSVKLTDASGNPVAGGVVTFNPTTNAGETITVGNQTNGGALTVTTSAAGIASLTAWTLGPPAQVYTLTAAAGATVSSVTFTATAVAGTGAKFLVSGVPSILTVGVNPGVVTVQLVDALNNPVAQAGVPITGTLTTQPGGVTNSGTLPTNASGIVIIPLPTPTGLIGTGVLTLTSPGYATFTSATVQIVTGAANKLIFTTQPGATAQSGAALSPQPVVQIADVGGNPVAQGGTTVTATAINNGSVLSGSVTAATNASGAATFTTLTATSNPGPHGLSFDVPGLTSATFLLTLTVGQPTSMIISAGNNQTAAAGNAVSIQPAVHITDAAGSPVPGVVVTFSAVTAGAQVSNGATSGSSVTVTTNASGDAVLTQWTLGTAAQFYTMTATSTGLPTQTFSATAVPGPASQLAFISVPAGAGTSGIALSAQPSVRLTDAFGNTIPSSGAVITASIASGTGTLANATASTVNGVATFSGLAITGTVGNFTLTFSAPNFSPVTSGAISIGAGAATRLAIVSVPSSALSGSALAPSPSVRLLDAVGNVVSTVGVSVTASLALGTGSVSNTTAVTSVSGVATFSGLAITGSAGTYALQFVSTGLASITSGSIALTAGAATSIALNAGNNQTATVNSAVAVAPVVRVVDVAGNPVAGVVVTFTAVTSGSTVSNASNTGTSVTVATNVSGLAQLSAWTLSPAAQTNSMTATATGLSGSPVTFTAQGVAGAGTNIVVVTTPAASGTSGAALSTQPAVQLKDAFGNNVSIANVTITASIGSGPAGSVSNATALTNASGLATFGGLTITGTAGNYTLLFTAPSYTSASFGVIAIGSGAATTIALNAGNNQTATVGTNVPTVPSVLVTDATGNPVSGTVVTFTAVTAGSSVANGSTSGTSVTVTTNASGIAQLNAWTLGTTAQTYTMTAAAAGLSGSPVTFTATAVAGSGTQLTFTTIPGVPVTSGTPFAPQPVIQLRDANGNAVSTAGVTITAAITSGTGTLSSPTATTASGGVATYSGLAITGTAGVFSVTFTAPGYAPLTLSSITLTAGTATSLAFNTSPGSTAQSAIALPTQPKLQLLDGAGNPVSQAGVTVTATIIGGTGTLANSTAVTASNGLATFSGLAISGAAGTFTLQFSASSLTPVASGAIVLSGGTATNLALNGGNNQTATVGTSVAIAPSVRVTDANSNPIAGTVVTFTAVTSGSSVANSSTSGTSVTVTTNASGIAQLNAWTLGTTAQAYTMTAAAAGLSGSPVTFSATAVPGSGTQLTFTTIPGATAASAIPFATQPVIQLRDANGNAVSTAGVTITAAITSGTGTLSSPTATTLSGGVATYSGLAITGTAGVFSVTFTAPGYAPLTLTSLTLTAGTATALAFNTSPGSTAQSGIALPTQPKLQLLDGAGNPVSQAGVTVTATIIGGTGTLANSTAVTASNGLATFSGLAISGSAGTFTLQFSASGLTPVASGAIVLSGGTATTLSLNGGNNQTATAGTSVAIAPSVRVTDANGNPVTGTVVTFTAVTSGSSVANSSTSGTSVTVPTNASGIAQLTAWTLGTTAQSYTMTATASGLAGSPVTFNASGVAGTATSLAFVQQPSSSATTGVPFATQPIVQLLDANANPVLQAGVSVSVSVTSGNGSLIGTSVVTTASNGQATFSGIGLQGLVTAPYSLAFGISGFNLPFSPITLAAGPASAIAVSAGNNQTAQSGQKVATPPSVKITDNGGNPIGGTVVTFTAVTSGGFLQNASTSGTSLTVTSNGSGIAALVSFFVGGTAQPYTLTASATGLAGSPVTFTETATAGAATRIVLTTQPSTTATDGVAFTTQPVAQITDAVGNPVALSGVLIVESLSGPGSLLNNQATTNASGQATFSNTAIIGTAPQSYSLGFFSPVNSSWTQAASNSIALAVGPATKLSVSAAGSTSATDGIALASAPAVQLTDVGGNNVTTSGVAITASIAAGSGSLLSATATTNASGIATFTGLTITGTVGTFTLTYSSGSGSSALTTLTSGSITLTAGAASSITVVSGSGQTATASSKVAIPPSVKVTDVGGNAIIGQVVTFNPVTSGSQITNSNTQGGQLSVITNGSGIAALQTWTLSSTPGTNTLTATVGAGSVSFSANGVASNGGSTQTVVQPTNSDTSGVVFATQPQIRLLLPSGAPAVGVPVTAFITPFFASSLAGSLGGTVTVNTNASGIAVFSGLFITNTNAGSFNYVLNFSSPGYGTVTASISVQ